ncbi:DUF397 domain-containing protein [Streptomyces fulvoviolaceus]|uniref:DUF397 domain-containing protein n=1 Tax=Streptomyces fulvoviolaceus TaxID=285535 RepID=UPI0021C2264C|nr:DUF397 domain-containing protein [Streptomyces fulvoviolaceus]MCT9084108.1 DUF397 domain-containing protein [Streptomyces fulvoviolaceus]
MTKHYPNAAATGFDWVKSSYSSGEQSCVEVAHVPGVVPVRDSKNPDGPALAIHPSAWSAFVDFARNNA